MTTNFSNEVLQNTTLQKIGRNVVNFQKMEVMLKFVIDFSNFRCNLLEIESHIDKRVTKSAKKPMGHLVDEVVKSLYSNDDSQQQLTTGAIYSISLKLDGSKDDAKVLKKQMMTVVKERNRLIHQMLASFDIESVESCENLCLQLDSQREGILKIYALLESLVSAIKSGHQDFLDSLAS